VLLLFQDNRDICYYDCCRDKLCSYIMVFSSRRKEMILDVSLIDLCADRYVAAIAKQRDGLTDAISSHV
jgi:hypothetical protein